MDGLQVSGMSDELWWRTLQHSPVGMALVATDGRFLAVNDALCSMFGYDAETLRGLTFQALTHPDDLEGDLRQFDQLVSGDITTYRMVKRFVHVDGSVVWGDLAVSMLRDEHDRPVHTISQIVDVTAQQRDRARAEDAEAMAAHQRQRAQAVLDTVGVGLLLLDADGRYETVNRRLQELLDLTFPDGHEGRAGKTGLVYGEDGETLLTREEMPSVWAAEGREFDDRRVWVGPPDDRRALSVSARSIRDADGVLRGSVLAYTEVTDLVRALTVRDDFLAMVSHELRTPLTAVLGHLELLTDGLDLPGPVARQVEVVDRNARRLAGLVNDLLDTARRPHAELQVNRKPVDLATVVTEAVEAARPAALRATQELCTDLPPTPVVAVVDPGRIRQVVDNLLANAIKYSRPDGRVTTTLTSSPEAVEIAVADTGEGLTTDELDLIFTRFYRARSAVDGHIPGTGLGLGIVRSIVEAHGGAVTATSEPGIGSTFTVRLPTTPAG